MSSTLQHRPVLDGLRGMAVALVVAYHFRPDLLGGGFVGVDVFFVLSGFLIGSLLLREAQHTGRVDLRRFVVRRVRRLAPATLLLLTFIAVYATTWANPFELNRLRTHGLWALFSLANWKFIAEGTTYTDFVVGASPLRHMWSLGIEEQFYIVLPLGIWMMTKLGVRRVRHVALVVGATLAVASAGWAAWLSVHGSPVGRTYFGTDTRAQALLIGVGLGAVLVGRPIDVKHRGVAATAAAVGAVVLAVMAVIADEQSSMMPRGGFLVVALASGLVVAGAEHLAPLRRLLTSRPLIGLGAISYGVYLWHWPVLVVFDAARVGFPDRSPQLLGVRLTITLVAALCSYWMLERPIRSGVLRRRLGRTAAGWSWAVAAAAVIAILVSSTALPTMIAGPTGLPPTGSTATSNTAEAAGSPATAGQPIDEPAPGPTTSAAPAAPVRLVMFGDSVAHSLAGGTVLDFPNVAPWTPEQATAPGLVSVARPGCSFLPGLVTLEGGSGSDLSSFCGDWRADLAASLDAADATHVALLLVNDMSDRLVDGDFVEFGSTEHQSLLQGFLDELRAIVSDRGAELVLLGPAPRDAEFVPVEGDRSELMLELLERYGAANAVKVVALAAAPATARFDGVHYSWEPARQVIAWLIEQVRR